MKNKERVLILLFILFNVLGFGQFELYNNKDSIWIQENAIVKVEGRVWNNGAIENKGLLDVDTDHHIDTLGVSKGSGEYWVKENWLNHNSFISDSSQVRLLGENQIIGGSQVTRFWNLSNENIGVKRLEIDSEILNELDLTSVETFVQDYKLIVLNAKKDAVKYDDSYNYEGFVSNNLHGEFIRYVDSSLTYVFPMGSSVSGHRFRKVQITQNSSDSGIYNVGFHNRDVNIDGMPRSMKQINVELVNELYYHTVYNSMNDNQASLSIDYKYNEAFTAMVNFVELWTMLSEESITGTNYNHFIKYNLKLDSANKNYAFSEIDTRITVGQLVTPNGDNNNDTWIIENIEQYKNNVKVFNRWGNLVFEENDYLNNWSGVANTGTNGFTGRDKLPSGTYYYIISLEGESPKTGYIQLHHSYN